MEQKQQKLEFRFGEAGKYIPVLIAVIFIIIAGTHQSNVNGYCLAFFAAVIIGAPFAKDFTAYGEAAVRGLGRPIFAIISVAVIIAAVNGKLVSSSGLIQSLAYLVVNSGMSGGLFAAMAFLICCVLSMATGTSVGTNVVSFPILFPVGVMVGVNPAVMAGALVSGALFGDNLAPISDTTITSANTQEAEMGGVVKSRMKYSLTAAVLSFIAILVFGGKGTPTVSAAELAFTGRSLIMIVIPVVVIVLCLRKQHLIFALSMGVVTGIVLSLVSGLYKFSDIFTFPGGWKVDGIFINAITGTVGTVFMLYGVFMLLGVMEASGVIEDIAELLTKLVKGPKSMEGMTVLSVGLLGWITGVTAVAMVAVGDVIKTLGGKYGVDKYRRANLMDCGGLAMTALAPWTVHAVLPASLANGAVENAVTPLSVVTHNYYCIILLLIMAFTIITRIGSVNEKA